jgi:hypothetical protein
VKESDIQIEVVDWFKSKQSEYRFRIFSVPNEGQRKVWFLNKLVKMGLKSGVPDLILEFPQGRMVYLEIKAEKGKLSETQQNWLKPYVIISAGFIFRNSSALSRVELPTMSFQIIL